MQSYIFCILKWQVSSFLFRVENIAQSKNGVEKFNFINMIILNKDIHLQYNKKNDEYLFVSNAHFMYFSR